MGHSHFDRLGFEALDACFDSSSTATALGSLATNQDMPIRPSGQCVLFVYFLGEVPWPIQVGDGSESNQESRGKALRRRFPVWTGFDQPKTGRVTFVYCGTLQGGAKPGNLPVTPGCTPVKPKLGNSGNRKNGQLTRLCRLPTLGNFRRKLLNTLAPACQPTPPTRMLG
jgi:hypothetical protein